MRPLTPFLCQPTVKFSEKLPLTVLSQREKNYVR
jgi:hypothetical protein